MKVAAIAISYLFHPLLLTTYLVLFLGFYFPVILGINPEYLLKLALFVFLVTCIFPVLNIALMLRLSGANISFTMNSRRARIAPFLFISLIYCFFAGLFFYKALLGMNFNKILAIISALVLVGTLITFFYKISIHSIAMGGLFGILLALNKFTGGALLYPTVIVLILAGFVMSSRLFLNAHTLREVLSGVLIGFAVGLGGMLLYF
jgi:hypothetical protein